MASTPQTEGGTGPNRLTVSQMEMLRLASESPKDSTQLREAFENTRPMVPLGFDIGHKVLVSLVKRHLLIFQDDIAIVTAVGLKRLSETDASAYSHSRRSER